MRIYKKEGDTVAPNREESEKKKVMKHELKVPKAGNLDSVRVSRLR